jgi:hypothetical protein
MRKEQRGEEKEEEGVRWKKGRKTPPVCLLLFL